MGHTKPEQLEDLQEILSEVRRWDGLRESAPNIFYFKSKPFFHFHDKDGRRWADAKDGVDWGKSIDIPFGASEAQKMKFLQELKRRYVIYSGPKKTAEK